MTMLMVHSWLGLDKATIQTYLDAYFGNRDPLLCMFLHKATFMHALQNGQLDRNLLKIVLAFGARLSHVGEVVSDAWAKEVELSIMSHVGRISMAQLRSVVVLLHYQLYYGPFDSTWMLLALAARLAFSQRLNFEIPSSDTVAQESSRRLIWSIFIIDKAIGGGMVDMSVCPTDRMHIRLPGNDRCFTYGLSARTPFLKRTDNEISDDLGTLGYNIRLHDIRDRILT